jgi:hypothetical protein
MRYLSITCLARSLCTLSLLALLIGSTVSPAQENNSLLPEGVDSLARGPVHEAYANPAVPQPEALPLVDKEPPPPIEEAPPDQRPEGDNVIWIPGYWSYDQDRKDYIWISGFWRNAPPGQQWVPGNWRQVGDQWQWSPGMWTAAQQTEVQYLPPPPAPIEAAPSIPAPDEQSFYVPGTWVYREARYRWRPGFWLGYRPGWIWVPAHFVWTPVGYVFVEGYWDYPLGDRGVLFSPIYFNRALVLRPGFVFRPRFVVNVNFLFGSLFVRRGYGGYYFGDYFEPAYSQAGFVPWIDFRVNRFSYDPLYSYYRFAYARDRAWDRELRTLYQGRFDGTIAAPPRTLVQQTKVINNITNNTTNVTNNTTTISNLTALTPINQLNTKQVKLVKVTNNDLVQQQKLAKEFAQAAVERRQMQTKLITQKEVPPKAADKPIVTKLDVPKISSGNVKTPVVTPPKLPTLPAHEDRPIPKAIPKEAVTPAPKKDTVPKKETTPPPKKDAVENIPPAHPDKTVAPAKSETPLPPAQPKHEPPPPKKETAPPVQPKHEVGPPPPPKHETPPPAKKEAPPPPKKETTPPPKKDKDKSDKPDKPVAASGARSHVNKS